MKGISSRYRPVFAGLAGLLLGWGGREWMRHEPGDSAGSEWGNFAGSARRGPPEKRSAPLPTGPMTQLLKDLSTATAAECEERVRALKAGNASHPEMELEAILRRWMEFEAPEAIYRKMVAMEGRWLMEGRGAFFAAWFAHDEAEAMNREILPIFDGVRALFAMDHGDPHFIDYLTEGRQGFLRFEEDFEKSLVALASSHPDVAQLITAKKVRVTEALRKKAVSAVARGWAMRDPGAALAWVRSLGLSREDFLASCGAVLSEWVKTDPTSAAVALKEAGLEGKTGFRLGDNGIGNQAIMLLDKPRDGSARMMLALHRDPFLTVEGLFQQLSEADIDWEKSRPMQPAIDHDGWYLADSRAAALDAEELPPGKARDYILENLCRNLAAEDLDAAVEIAARNGITSSYLESLQSEPGEDEIRAAFAAPEESFASLFEPGEGTDPDRTYKLAMKWAEVQPEAAAGWLILQPLPEGDGPGRDQLLFSNTLGYHWARNDALGAVGWMESLPDGPTRARAWRAMQDRVSEYSPDLAFELSVAQLEGESRLPLMKSQLQEVAKSIGYPAAFELLNSPDVSARNAPNDLTISRREMVNLRDRAAGL
ncbi:hypothetical protein [Luteolibacter marinus]|uniref:hypothetical protein n=1 Tax=Luteolibacter marinus TaxID=2776705 RepID=UPI0018679223|nr:hypothetical protein [Luteolibacter marinus]